MDKSSQILIVEKDRTVALEMQRALILQDYVVYVTADIGETMVEEIRRTQPFGYVNKPFRDVDLQAAVAIALDRYGADNKVEETRRSPRHH